MGVDQAVSFQPTQAGSATELADPGAALGSESSAAAALRQAGFAEIPVVADRVLLSDVGCWSPESVRNLYTYFG
jgi:hypothetical protein